MDLWQRHTGTSRVLIDIPHCGTHVPAEIARDMTPAGKRVLDTDWHVEKLYAFAPKLGAGLFHATHSRYVADLNRDPDGKPLYPGADNTEVCPLRSFHDAEIWLPGRAPDAVEVRRRVAAYWRPYHAALAAEIAAVKARHGYCVLLDGHSIFSEVPRFFAGKLPDLNLGTADGKSCTPALQARAAEVLAGAAGFSHVVNGRFKGGYITRHYGKPGAGRPRAPARNGDERLSRRARAGALRRGTGRAPDRGAGKTHSGAHRLVAAQETVTPAMS